MTKEQLNVRISQATRDKLDHLTERHGTQTETVAVAIDRLYQAERPKEKVAMYKVIATQTEMALVAEGANIEDVRDALNAAQEGAGYILTDDNGGDPDGDLWMVPEDDLPQDAVRQLAGDNQLQLVPGDIVEYDGCDSTRAALDQAYPDGWCGFSSRDEAYCWTPELPGR